MGGAADGPLYDEKMNRTSLILATGSILAIVAALYCFAGYAMNASFSVAGDDQGNAQAAVVWGGGGLISGLLGFGLAVAAWKRNRTKA